GRTILQRTVERAQMEKLLATGKTDLLQFVSSRTRRPFSAFLVRQPDGKVGFEFEKRERTGGGRGARAAPAALKVLGKHPKDGKPVELHAGRYGPYVKHGDVNATIPDRERADAITLDEAVALIAERAGRTPSKPARKSATTRRTAKEPAPTARKRATKTPSTGAAKTAARPAAKKSTAAPATKSPAAKAPATKKPAPAARKTAAAPAAKKPVAKKSTAKRR
ncbi:MAG: topoisomerase C-terminal repeat-containing protein, partial [Burkholderiales bacterium]|nr:topoisomerase C-terminal repeat-containing protein [Burkholderiales bacterium]